MGTCLIIDSNAICHASFHAMGDLKYDTKNTGVIFGFMLQVQYLATLFHTNNFLFCWDSRRSWRKNKYPWYKNKDKDLKKKTQKDIDAMAAGYEQFNLLRRSILPEIGFKNHFIATGYESDDLMAQLVLNPTSKSPLVMVTHDEDTYQMLDYCKIYLFRKKKMYTKMDFVKEYGIEPKQWVKVKQIAGCTSDRVPGIDGVGEKTAIKYITDCISPGKKKAAIVAQAGQSVIERNKWLVELPLPGCPVPTLQQDEFDPMGFFSVCEEYGMESFTNPKNMTVWNNIFNMR